MLARLGVAFLGKGLPFPAERALIRASTVALSVTLLAAWPTRVPKRKICVYPRSSAVFSISHSDLVPIGQRFLGSLDNAESRAQVASVESG